MTIANVAFLSAMGSFSTGGWNTELDASHTTAKEVLGSVRFDYHPNYGLRGFEYVRFDVATTAGDLCSQQANTTITNITSGTTTSITTSSLTADIHVNGLLVCTDDAGAAGAAPEGEVGRIIANTTTVVTIDSADAFSAAPAANDDFIIIKPWAVIAAAAGHETWRIKGVAIATQAQYDYGWVQFLGVHPAVRAKAAAGGVTVTAGKGVIADTSAVVDGSTSAITLLCGVALGSLAADTVRRTVVIDLFCGKAAKLGVSA